MHKTELVLENTTRKFQWVFEMQIASQFLKESRGLSDLPGWF